jgi:sulfur carrier protein
MLPRCFLALCDGFCLHSLLHYTCTARSTTLEWMQLLINGVLRNLTELGAAPTLAETLAALELQADRVAVEHNGGIVARADWPVTQVHEGDKLEIVQFVGGGHT